MSQRDIDDKDLDSVAGGGEPVDLEPPSGGPPGITPPDRVPTPGTPPGPGGGGAGPVEESAEGDDVIGGTDPPGSIGLD